MLSSFRDPTAQTIHQRSHKFKEALFLFIMASSINSHIGDVPKPNQEGQEELDKKQDCYENTYQKHKNIIPTLPREKGWTTEHLVQYQGTWLSPEYGLKGLMLAQQHFKALPTDVLLVTFPKCGTTWFKALVFSITNRDRFDFSTHPLLTTSPHDCVPFLEIFIDYQNRPTSNLNLSSSPRLLSTHIPYALLPDSVQSSGCKIVYVCRNPKDVFVSMWHFVKQVRSKHLPPLPLGEAFELFCKGITNFGPIWDQILGYWQVSLKSPEKILFLTYEDVKKEPMVYVKKIANFLGCPFSAEEEREGVVQEIIRLCSFENLSKLEVTEHGVFQMTKDFAIENQHFLRKGQIGDWENHLTTEMVECLDRITEQRFAGSGLNIG